VRGCIVKTIEEFLTKVREAYARVLAYGKWADLSPYSDAEAWKQAFLTVSNKYYMEVTHDRSMGHRLDRGDRAVVAGRGRHDEVVQALDKGEDKMRDLLPGTAKDQAFSDKCVILLIRLVAQLKLVHRSTEYIEVWEHNQYHGPTYTKEYEEARAHVEQKFDKPAYGLGQVPVKKEGGWTEEFMKEVYDHSYQIYRELDLRIFLDPQVQEASRRLIKSWNEVHPAEEDILRIRCTQHHQVPQMNSAAAGAECGVCVINTAIETLRMQAKENGPFMGPYPGNSPAEQERMLMMSFQKPFSTKQVETINDLVKTWHGRFLNVINVGEAGGGFPVYGEVYHRREVTDKVNTFDLAFEQLRHRLLNKENFEGDTLYVRVAPMIEKVYDFDSTKDVYCGIARFSYTVKHGTVVVDKDAFLKP